MIHSYVDPFLTFIPGTASNAEIEALMQRSEAIEALLAGKESPSMVLDMLDAHGLNPIEYVDSVEAFVDAVCDENATIEDAQLLLKLRE